MPSSGTLLGCQKSRSAWSTQDISAEFLRAQETTFWVYEHVDKLRLPGLPTIKRHQLASAALHVAIDHSQAIVCLVHNQFHASALALVRPLFEAYLRGAWLANAASDADIDRAGRDRFPGTDVLFADLEKVSMPLTFIKVQGWWNAWCSYTHTGYQQIGAQFTPEGLGANYRDEEVQQALKNSWLFSLLVVIEFAKLADNQPLAVAALEKMKAVDEPAAA